MNDNFRLATGSKTAIPGNLLSGITWMDIANIYIYATFIGHQAKETSLFFNHTYFFSDRSNTYYQEFSRAGHYSMFLRNLYTFLLWPTGIEANVWF